MKNICSDQFAWHLTFPALQMGILLSQKYLWQCLQGSQTFLAQCLLGWGDSLLQEEKPPQGLSISLSSGMPVWEGVRGAGAEKKETCTDPFLSVCQAPG